MDEVVFLQVSQLGEGLAAGVALEGPLSAVRPQVNLQVGELAKDLATMLAFVLDLAVFLLQGIGQ